MKCRECEHMQVKRTMYGVGCRRECFCKHPVVSEVYLKDESASWKKQLGFIGYTEMDGRTVGVKTCPRWCPRKEGA